MNPNTASESHEPPGTPIKDSRLVRDYCLFCGEPMRVTRATGDQMCTSCRKGVHPGTGSPYYVADPDANGVWANGVKALESR